MANATKKRPKPKRPMHLRVSGPNEEWVRAEALRQNRSISNLVDLFITQIRSERAGQKEARP